MGGGLIVGGTVAVVVLITTPIVVLIRESLQRRKNLHMDDDEPEDTPGYQSLASLVKRHQRRVRFAKKNIEYPPSPELAGGTVGGVVGMSVVYPLDTVKSRMQTSGHSRYSSIASVLSSMARSEGVMSLYRGLLSPVTGYGAMFAISFSSYGHAGRFLSRRRGAHEDDRLTLPEMGLAGAWAGVMNAPLRQVFERVKGVMQVRQGKNLTSPYSWSGACFVDLVRREGVAMGLFRGMGPTLLREPIQFAIYYPSYEIVKDWLMLPGRVSTGVPEAVLQVLAGGVAGCAMWLPPVYCLDVVKTRMQTAQDGVYRGMWDCLVKTVRAGGAPVLFRGFAAAMLRAFPMHGLVFLGYETTIDLLDARPRRRTSTAEASLTKQPVEEEMLLSPSPEI
eukprot:g1933.t1